MMNYYGTQAHELMEVDDTPGTEHQSLQRASECSAPQLVAHRAPVHRCVSPVEEGEEASYNSKSNATPLLEPVALNFSPPEFDSTLASLISHTREQPQQTAVEVPASPPALLLPRACTPNSVQRGRSISELSIEEVTEFRASGQAQFSFPDDDTEDTKDDDPMPQVSPYKPPKRHTFHSLLRDEESAPLGGLRRSNSVDCMLRHKATGGSMLPRVGPLPLPFATEGDVPAATFEAIKKGCLQPATTNIFTLPTVVGSCPDAPCIAPETMADILRGHYDSIFKEIFVIDCRYGYEYEGGHIRGACNVTDRKGHTTEQQLREMFFTNPKLDKVLIVFHCEFSRNRGPHALRTLRELDRKCNTYPNIYYHDVYLLEGGFHDFFPKFGTFCEPMSYTQMIDKKFSKELKKCKSLLKQHTKNREPLPLRRTQSGTLLKSFKVRVQEQTPVESESLENNSNGAALPQGLSTSAFSFLAAGMPAATADFFSVENRVIPRHFSLPPEVAESRSTHTAQ